MKKTVIVLVLILSVITIVNSQDIECIYCNDNHLGFTSSVIGSGNTNFGDNSLTVGTGNYINKGLQIVTLIGDNNQTNSNELGNYSLILGNNNLLIGDSSILLGNYNELAGMNSFILGTHSQITSDFSASIGYKNINTGIGSLILGNFSEATSTYSTAIGMYAYSYGMSSIALGSYAKTNKMFSLAIGNHVIADADFSIVMGGSQAFELTNTVPYSLMVGFNSDVPTLFVSASAGSGTTGNVGIGNITVPEAKLHIKSDGAEDATMFIQPNYWDIRDAEIQLGTPGHAIRAKKNHGLIFKTEANYLFNDGNVGIGTSTPTHLLEVNGTFKVQDNSYLNNLILDNDLVMNNSAIWDVGLIVGYNGLSLYGDLSGGTDLKIDADGNVGIGTTSPTHLLEVVGDMQVSSDSYLLGNVGIGTTSPTHLLEVVGDMQVSSDSYLLGNVGIGTTNINTNYILNVSGKILAEELKIQDVVGADFVFYDDYKLPSLEDVEKFIEKNNHLPEIPSAEEMKTNGVEIGDLQIKLLQKVEELTLYIIEQQKEIEKLKEKVGR